MINKNEIKKAEKVLKRIEPEFHHLEVKNSEVRLFRKFFNDGQDFGGISSNSTWKEIVRKFISLIEWGKYMQRECNQWGCD